MAEFGPQIVGLDGLDHDQARATKHRSSDGRWEIYERWFKATLPVAESSLPARGTLMLAAADVPAGQFNPVLFSSRVTPIGNADQCYVVLSFRSPVIASESISTNQAIPATASLTIYTAAAVKVIRSVKVRAANNGSTGSATVQVTRTRGVTTVNVLTAVVTVANADANGTWYAGTIDTANDDLAVGDIVKLEITKVSSWDGANLATDVEIGEA